MASLSGPFGARRAKKLGLALVGIDSVLDR
jgi:hypothetical protein